MQLAFAMERALLTAKEAADYHRKSERDIHDIELDALAIDAWEALMSQFRMQGVTAEMLKRFSQLIG